MQAYGAFTEPPESRGPGKFCTKAFSLGGRAREGNVAVIKVTLCNKHDAISMHSITVKVRPPVSLSWYMAGGPSLYERTTCHDYMVQRGDVINHECARVAATLKTAETANSPR